MNAAHFAVAARPSDACTATLPLVTEVRFFAKDTTHAQSLLATLKANGMVDGRVLSSERNAKDDCATFEVVRASPLQPYEIEIIHYAGGRYGALTAALIAQKLREAPLTGSATLSPKPTDELGALFEVRSGKGEEEPAAYLLTMVETVKEANRPVMFLVEAKPTPKYLAIFVPRQQVRPKT